MINQYSKLAIAAAALLINLTAGAMPSDIREARAREHARSMHESRIATPHHSHSWHCNCRHQHHKPCACKPRHHHWWWR